MSHGWGGLQEGLVLHLAPWPFCDLPLYTNILKKLLNWLVQVQAPGTLLFYRRMGGYYWRPVARKKYCHMAAAKEPFLLT